MSCVVKGYDEQVEAEQQARNLAYLGQPEIVCGEKLRNITPHLLAVLTAMRSPFYLGGPYDLRHVAQFLWACHLDYGPNKNWCRHRLIRRVRKMDVEKAAAEIDQFIETTFMDSPRGGDEEKPIASNIAWMIYRFRHDPWRQAEEVTMHTPLRKLFQELRCFQREQGKVVGNKSDQAKAEWLSQLNAWLAENPEQHQKELDEWNAAHRRN